MEIVYQINDKGNFQLFYHVIKSIRKDSDNIECMFNPDGLTLMSGLENVNNEKAKHYYYFNRNFFERCVNNQPEGIHLTLNSTKQLLLRLQGIKKTVNNLIRHYYEVILLTR